jgi:type I restriction enzyme S subunit
MIDDLQPYPEYRSADLPWLNRVPTHWDIKRGKALFQESQLPVREGDEIVTCFRDGQVTLRRNRRTTGFMVALYEAGYQGVRKGQLVIHAMDAFAGAIGISDSDGKCTPEYIVCEPRSASIVPAYYAQVLRVMAEQGFILASCPAVRERAPRFRYPNFGDIRLPLPPPGEQEAIVNFLARAHGRIERAVRAKRRLIALLNEQKQAIVYRAVTRGIDPSANFKPSGVPWLGHIPEHWVVRRLKFLAHIKTGGRVGSTHLEVVPG